MEELKKDKVFAKLLKRFQKDSEELKKKHQKQRDSIQKQQVWIQSRLFKGTFHCRDDLSEVFNGYSYLRSPKQSTLSLFRHFGCEAFLQTPFELVNAGRSVESQLVFHTLRFARRLRFSAVSHTSLSHT